MNGVGIENYAGNATAGTYPDVMLVILDNRVDHIVHQSRSLVDFNRGGLRLFVQLKASGCAYPCPITAVDEHASSLPSIVFAD